MKQRFTRLISLLLSVMMVISMLPTAALADELVIDGESMIEEVVSVVEEEPTTEATAIDLSEGSYTIGADGEYVVSAYTGGNTLTVNANATVTLQGVNITAAADTSAISIESGDVTLIVAEDSTLIGGDNGAGVYVAEGASVTIQGGKLTAIGNAGVDDASGAAGIGGTWANGNSGAITIDGATVVAEGYGVHGSGIGSGSGKVVGEIRIVNGANVTAVGGYYANGEGTKLQTGYGSSDPEGGAAIGGGGKTVSTIADITITDSTVVANGGSKAAGIGANFWSSTGTITISGNSDVTAQGGSSSAGIGTSRAGSNGVTSNIIISGGAVKATGGAYGAGIGAGYNGDSLGNGAAASALPETSVTISGGTVIATGGEGGAGIGGGYKTDNTDIDITGGNVTATAGELVSKKTVKTGGAACGIGSGANGSGKFENSPAVEIGEDATVNVTAYYGGKAAIEGVTNDDADALSNVKVTLLGAPEEDTWYDPDATAYVINDLDELKAFAAAVNAGNNFAGKIVKLGNDIDLAGIEWAPIGGDTVYFAGEFDGQDFAIQNLTQTQGARMGLFGMVEKAYIHDLTLSNVNFTVDADSARVGALAGNFQYWNVVEDVTIDGINITVNGNSGLIGAVGGYVWKSQFGNVDVKNAVFTVNGTSNVLGGHTGYGRAHVWDTGVTGNNAHWLEGTVQTIDGTEYVLQNYFVDCDVTGIKMTLNGTGSEAGGFFGSDTYNSHSNYFVDCSVFNLDVTAAEGTSQVVGGFIAWNNGTTAAGTVRGFDGCSVTGTIKGANGTYGGFAAQVGGRLCEYYNATADVDITSTGTAGGFVGLTAQYFTHLYTFDGCEATGDVSGNVAGGFAGRMGMGGDGDNVNAVLTNCSASGAISGVSYAGGLIGVVDNTTKTVDAKGTLALTLNKAATAAENVTVGEEGLKGGLIGNINAVTSESYPFVVELLSNSYTFEPAYNPVESDVVVSKEVTAIVDGTTYDTLKEAVAAANAIEGGATVELLANVTLGEKLTITGNVTISGAKTITRDDAYTGTLFAVNAGAALTLDGGLTIDGANEYVFNSKLYEADLANWEAAVPAADNTKWFTPEEGAPVATAYMITTSGIVNLNAVTIKNHYSTNGSGIVSAGKGANVTLEGAQITHNASTSGSGLVVNASANVWSREEELITVTMNEGTVIDGNHVGGNHGIFKIYMGTYFTMNGGKVKNTTGWNSNGSVVGMYHAVFTMNGGTICSNSSVYGPNNGRNAAIYGHTNHLFTMNGGTVCHNSGRAKGGIDSPYSEIGYTGQTFINGGSVLDNTVIGTWDEPDVSGGATLTVSGGTFTQDVSKYLAPDTGLVQNADGTYTTTDHVYNLWFRDPVTHEQAPYIGPLKGSDPASMVTTGKAFYANYYEMELEVLANAKIDETIVVDYPMTINLNGKTLTTVATAEDTYIDAFQILADVTVTGNGTVDARPAHSYAFYVGDKEGKTGNLTIENGTFYGDTSVAQATTGTVTIKGGNFAVAPYVAYEGAEENYNYLLNCWDTNFKNGTAKIEVNGGTFHKFNPADNAAEGANTSFVADGYMAEADGDYFTVVEAATPVAMVVETEVEYTSLKEALEACTKGETVQLIADITYEADDVVPAHGGATGFGKYDASNPSIIYLGGTKGATDAENQPSRVNAVLDLNGHTITNNAAAYLFLPMDNAKLTFKDSIGNGTIVSTTEYPVIWVAGTDTLVTIESGKYVTANDEGLLWSTHAGDLVITGGEFSTTADDASLLVMRNSKVFNNPNYFLKGVATVTIKGGTFKGFNPEQVQDDNTTPFTVVDAVPLGYEPVKDANGNYGVVEATELKIWTVEDLYAFAAMAKAGETFTGKTVNLMADIDLSGATWTPISSFNGNFVGNNHTISNFKIDATNANGGFFNKITGSNGLEDVRVKDLILSDVTATVGNARFGTLANSIAGVVHNVTVKNLTVTTTHSAAWVGGMCAFMDWPWMTNCTVENMTVNAEAGAEFIAGFACILQKNSNHVFDNLDVNGFKVTVNDTDGSCGVAGFVGQTQRGWENPKVINSDVTGIDVTATGTVDVGGFIAWPGAHTIAENCSTEGTINVTDVTSASNFAGGFFGNLGWNCDLGQMGHKVTDCSANVEIITKKAAAGGFVGSATNSNKQSMYATFTDCSASGNVTCVADGTAPIGGFAGDADRGVYTNCTATGTVTNNGTGATGGFIGEVKDVNPVYDYRYPEGTRHYLADVLTFNNCTGSAEPFIGIVADTKPVEEMINVNSYVAEVDGTYYVALETALNAAAATEHKAVTILGTTVIAEDTTLDLLGCTLTATDVYPVIRVQDGANVTVKNGEITNNDYIFVLGASDGSSAGDLTIESGTYHGDTTVASVTKGTLTIKGGEFSVDPYKGTYEFTLNCIDANYQDGSASIVVKGGKFYKFNPANNAAEGTGTSFVADGYEAVGDGDYYVVSEIEDVEDPDVTITFTDSNSGEEVTLKYPSEQYSTIQALISGAMEYVDNGSASNNFVMTLHDDIALATSINFNRKGSGYAITIDGNGHTITWADGCDSTLLYVDPGVSVTTQNLTIDGGNAFTFYNDTTNVENGQNWYTRFVDVGEEDKVVKDYVIVVQEGNLTLGEGTKIQNVTIAANDDRGQTQNTDDGGYKLTSNSDLALIYVHEGTVNLTGATITGNAGMVLFAYDTDSVISGSTICGNLGAGSYAGLIDVRDGTMEITKSTISNNKAMTTGSTIMSVGGSAEVTFNATMENNKYLGNMYGPHGSMVLQRGASQFLMTGGSISHNVGNSVGAVASTEVGENGCGGNYGQHEEASIILRAGTITGNTVSNEAFHGASIVLNSPAIIEEGMRVDGPIVVSAKPGELDITGGTFNGSLTVVEGRTAEITGGTFNYDPTEWCAEGYAAVDNGNGTWTVKSCTYVEWVKAQLLVGNSVTLDQDIVINDYALVNALKLPSNGNGKYTEVHGNGAVFHVIKPGVELDLNGHSITWDAHDDAYCNKRQVSLFMVTITGNTDETASLTVKDSVGTGKVDVYGMGTGMYVVGVDATGTITGGTWTNYPCNTCEASNIFMYPSHGGELHITGGTFEQQDSDYLLGWKGSTKETTNNGVGTDFDETKVVISGGTFVNFNPEEVKFFDTANSGKEIINGCATGFGAADDGKGNYTVKPVVTVTFDDVTITEGDALPKFTYTSNFTEIAEDGMMLVVEKPVVNVAGVGEYDITANAYIFMSDDYIVKVVPGKLTVKEAVAEMDGVKYASIKDALATLKSADTTVHKLKVLKDHEIDVNYHTFNYPILVNGFAVEIDLNGKTITADWSKYNATTTRKDNALIGVCNGGKLDMIDSVGGGKIVNNDDLGESNDTIAAQNRIFWIQNSTETKQLIVNIKGGTFVQNDDCHLLYIQGDGKNSTNAGVIVNITGGYFEQNAEVPGEGYDFFNAYNGNSYTAEISGGTFNHNPGNYEVVIAEGYKVEENEDSTWTVQRAPKFATLSAPVIGGYWAEMYAHEGESLAEVYDAYTNMYLGSKNWKVTMHADYEAETALNIATAFNVTIEAGEYKLLGAINVAEGATVVIKSGTFNDATAKAYVADGYTAKDNEDGTWTVVEAGAELFDITSSNLVLGNEIAMYFYVQNEDLNGEDYVAVVTKSYADGTDDLVVKIPYSEWEARPDGRMRFKFDGIAAKEMSDNINVVIYAASTDEVASNPYNDSVRGYVERGFEAGKATGELATMLVDMLNYGAAAQRMFTYDVENLANKNMDAYQNLATPSVTCENNQMKGQGYVSASLILESNIVFNMKFSKNNVTTDMTAVATYKNHYGEEIEIRISGSEFEDRGDTWGVLIEELVPADAGQIITCKFVDADGNEVEGVYGQDSIESVCARAIAGGGGSYYEDIMKFATAAYNYFH